MPRIRSRSVETESVNQRMLRRGAVKRQHISRWAVGHDELAPGVVGDRHLHPRAIERIRDVATGMGVGQLLVLSATGQSFADGGEYVEADSIVYQHGFDDVTTVGESIVWPVAAVGEIQVEFAWDTYEGGGTIEIEVDGEVPAWGLIAEGTSGREGCKRRSVHIGEGSTVKVKVTQDSGDPQVADVLVELSIPDPTLSTGSIFIDFESDGWRYKVIGRTDNTDYSDPLLDDSAWTTGAATFGANDGIDIDRPITTTTSLDVRTWLRRSFSGTITSATVTVMADNIGEAWWNGVYLGTFTKTVVLDGDLHEFEVPAAALSGTTSHVLAVRVTDDVATSPDNHYADARIVATG